MPALVLVAVLLGAPVTVWLGWSTVVAFVGGHIPLTPFHLTGHNALRGIAWLVTADPIALGVLATAISLVAVTRARTSVPAAPATGRLGAGRQVMTTAAMTSHVASGLRIMLVAAFTLLVCMVAAAWLLWTTAVAFVGGTVPLTGLHLSGFDIGRGVIMLFVGVPIGLYVLLLGYSLAVAAAASKQMRAGLDAVAAQRHDVHTARAWLRIISWLSFAVAVAAGLAWTFTT